MDPNANLEEIRELCSVIGEMQSPLDQHIIETSDRLVELLEAMDEWLSKGGFLPDAWKLAAGEAHWQTVLASTNERAYKRGYEDAQFDAKDGEL